MLLTVGASEHLHPQAHIPAGVPVKRDEAQETSLHRVGQLVLDHALWIDIPDKSLQEQEHDGEQVSLILGLKHFFKQKWSSAKKYNMKSKRHWH